MSNDTRRHLRQALIKGVSEVLPNAFFKWVESTDHKTEKITVRLTLEVSGEIRDEALLSESSELYCNVVGNALYDRMKMAIRKALGDYCEQIKN